MSKPQVSSIDRKNLYRFQQVKSISKSPQKLENNPQNIRDLVMDIVLQKSLKQKQKSKIQSNKDKQKRKSSPPSKLKSLPQINKKVIISFCIELNNEFTKIQYDVCSLIEQFIYEENKNNFQSTNLQTLVDEIVNFIEEIQTFTEKIQFDLDPSQQNFKDKVISLILHNHFKQKHRLNRIKDLDILKSKTIKINQTKKQQTSQENDHALSHRISRDTLLSTQNDKDSQPLSNQAKSTKSKLKDLIQNNKIFLYPQRVQRLRNQKIQQLYDGFDIDQITEKSKTQYSNFLEENKINKSNQINFLIQWITDIDISEKLFLKKLQNQHKKIQKQSQIKVQKIIEEIDSQRQIQLSKKSI